MLDVKTIRDDFPILERQVHGKPLVYLDNAATSQKPLSVIEAVSNYYKNYNSNIHRGIHTLSEEATAAFEETREKVADFIHAPSPKEVIFTRGTTESINLVAQSWGGQNLKPGDEILLTQMEHHSNIVPWQMVAKEKQAKLKYCQITAKGELDYNHFKSLLTPQVKMVAMCQVSNVLGTLNAVECLSPAIHKNGSLLLVDAAQSVPHQLVDVVALGADFLAFSGHKMLGPTGAGVLWGRKDLLDKMEPMTGGGHMILEVKWEQSTWNEVPYKFEAGTMAISSVIGLGAAIDYIKKVGIDAIHEHEIDLTEYALNQIGRIPGVTLYGPREAVKRSGIVSFNIDGVHAHDVGTVLDQEGIAIRAGHHCAQPLMSVLGVASTARASFYLYNKLREVDQLVEAIKKTKEFFKRG